jgi:integrase
VTKIVKQPDGSYKARPIIDNKKLTVRAATKREVERQLAQLKAQQQRQRLGLPDPDSRPLDITWDELCAKVLEQYPHKPQSRETLANNLARSRKEFGRVLVRDLLPENVGAWLAGLGLSTTTKRTTLKAMRYALQRGVVWEYVSTNRAKDVEMPPEPEYDACPFESWEEVHRVSAAAKQPRDKALILFASATGLRPQEWQALQWRDLKLKARTLRVNRTMQRRQLIEHVAKTRGSLRTVLLTDTALAALDLLPTALLRDQLVFAGKNGDVLDLPAWRRGPWKKALAAAAVTYREPYGMRDTFATLCLSDGAPLEWISEQMGHSEIDTTRRHYARWQPATDYRIVDALNRARSEATGLETDSAEAAS